MCGRFSLTEELGLLQEEFGFEFSEEITPKYNIAPGQDILAVGFNKNKGRVGNFLRAKEPKIGNKLINARMETIDQKPSFRQAFQKRRCLILSSGFYEWKKTEEGKQPFRFVMQDKRPFAFAGLYEVWNKGEGKPLATCTIITTNPNDVWLNPDNHDFEQLKGLLKPYEAEEMMKYEVSTLVNSPKNEGEALFAPINSK